LSADPSEDEEEAVEESSSEDEEESEDEEGEESEEGSDGDDEGSEVGDDSRAYGEGNSWEEGGVVKEVWPENGEVVGEVWPEAGDTDTSDEEEVRNTLGNIPLEWYEDYDHLGYSLEGVKIPKPLSDKRDQVNFINRQIISARQPLP